LTGISVGSIGSEFAFSLSRNGSPSQIILLGRDQSKISPVIAEISRLNPSVETFYIPLDLSSEVSIRAAAHEIMSNSKISKVDVTVNSAGIMACPYTPVKEWKDKEGRPLELQFATNHIGHFLLTNLLMPKIRNAGPGTRIVNVSSSGHRFNDVRFDDVGFSVSRTILFFSRASTSHLCLCWRGINI
jgi:NAD(P)-dependent dehydrogenase (short-subunit alcohol dehydrogenase family)